MQCAHQTRAPTLLNLRSNDEYRLFSYFVMYKIYNSKVTPNHPDLLVSDECDSSLTVCFHESCLTK